MPECLVERDGAVVVVTMNRPERRNALSPEMLCLMYDAWCMVDSDPEVRCAILTGAGGTFCSGADLKAMAAGNQGSRLNVLKSIPRCADFMGMQILTDFGYSPWGADAYGYDRENDFIVPIQNSINGSSYHEFQHAHPHADGRWR